jgi:hypothetical protein
MTIAIKKFADSTDNNKVYNIGEQYKGKRKAFLIELGLIVEVREDKRRKLTLEYK